MNDFSLQNELQRALHGKNLSKVRELLNKGASPNISNVNQWTPMESAITADFVEGVEALVNAGGDINLAGYNQHTPLITAAGTGMVAIGQWLLRHGADDQLVSDAGMTALGHALKENYIDFAKMLLQERPQTTIETLSESTRKAMQFMDDESLQWVLEAGVSPNLTTPSGSPWIVVAQAKSLYLCGRLTDLLLSAGADPDLQDFEGLTALHKAFFRSDADNFKKLLMAGSDPGIPDNQGYTVRWYVKANPKEVELYELFHGWEASCSAQQAMQIVSSASNIRSL